MKFHFSQNWVGQMLQSLRILVKHILLDLGSREAIAEAKLEIVEGLPEDGLLIYPGNEPLLAREISKMTHLRHRLSVKRSKMMYIQISSNLVKMEAHLL